MNENVRQKEGKALRPWCEDEFITQSSNREAELRTCCSALRLRDLKTRVFLKPGPPGEQVKAVADALDADLIVSSCDYHRRFLSYLTHAPTGTLRLQGVACPVVLVNDASVMPQ